MGRAVVLYRNSWRRPNRRDTERVINIRSTVVKPYLSDRNSSEETKKRSEKGQGQVPLEKASTFPCTAQSSTKSQDLFTTSRMAEFNALTERSVFTLVPSSAAKGLRIYRSRFVHHIKHEGMPHGFEKSRLVVRAYNDSNHGLLTHAPTVQRVSQRLLLAFCRMHEALKLFTHDVSQAYIQSETQPSAQFL